MPTRIDATRLAERVRANQREGQRRHRQRLAGSGLTQIAVWIPATTRQRLDAMAAESQQTLSAAAAAAIDAGLDARIADIRARAQRAVEKQRTEAAAAGLLLPGVNITDPIFPDHQTPDTRAESASLVSGLDSGGPALPVEVSNLDTSPDLSTDSGNPQLSPPELSTDNRFAFSDAEIAYYSGQPMPEPPRRHTGGKPAIPDDIVQEVRLLYREGWSHQKIADHLRISATSVGRILKRGA